MRTPQSKPTEPTGTENPTASGADLPVAVGTAAMQAWMDIGSEAVQFVLDRMQQDIKAQQALLACKSLAEIQKVQAEFFHSAQAQYTAKTSKMLEMMGKAATGGLAAPGKARKYNDVPL